MCAIRAGAQGSRIGRTADVAGDSVRTTVFWRAMPGHRRSMTLRATALLQVTDMLYTAALIDDVKGAATAAWAGALGLLGQTCGATGSVVMGISCSRHEFLRAVFVGRDPCTAGRYTSYYAARDPVLEPALARSAPGTLLFSESLIERPVFIRSEFYCDWMQSIGMFAGAAVTLVQSETSRAVLYMSRERTAGSFTIDDEAALASLIPHLQRASQLAIRLAAHQSVKCQRCACDGAVLFECSQAVGRTGWLKSASTAKPRAEQQAIGFDKSHQGVLRQAIQDRSKMGHTTAGPD